MTATLAERAAVALGARGIVPPSHRSPKPYFDPTGWRWLPVFKTEKHTDDYRKGWIGWALDLEDDGNKGRLLGVVRRVWGRQLCAQPSHSSILVSPKRIAWRIVGGLSANEFHEINRGHVASGADSEAEALVVALERAP